MTNLTSPGSSVSLTGYRTLSLGLFLAAMVFIFVAACGESNESTEVRRSLGARGAPGEPGEAGAPGQRGTSDSQVVVETVVVEKAVEVEVAKEVMVGEAMMMATAAPEMAMEMPEEQSAQDVDISFQPQNRVIVRNADMSVEADNPIATVDAIGDIAVSRGGWVVNINTIEGGGFYHITIRIPAETLDNTIDQISAIVTKVESVNSDSTDFTEEYIDLGARRTTIQETVNALTELLKNENYDRVEELLAVQKEITYWQAELERIDGRLAFISESAAFSRLSVNVNRSPIPMRVDVGEDVNIGIGVGRKYTARFFPPEGYDSFEIVWDFGDGTAPRTVRSGLRTQGDDGYLSVPVRHTYHSDELSPHVVTVTVKAFSDRGLAEGEGQLWAHVSELPRIDAFVSGPDRSVQQGETVTLTASFNHPETLRDVRYNWDFRDGSTVVSGTVDRGDTGIDIEHVFERFRPEPYGVVFEIWGNSDAGEVRETLETLIWVDPAPTVDSSDIDAGGTATNAVNVLVGFFSFAVTAAIWLGITSPIWLIIGAIIFFIVRFIIRRQRNAQRVVYVPTQPDDDHESDEGNKTTASA